MYSPSRETIEQTRKDFPVGCRVKLISMDDKQAPPVGTCGTVRGVDGIGSILIRWDTGSRLSVIPGVDVIEIIND